MNIKGLLPAAYNLRQVTFARRCLRAILITAAIVTLCLAINVPVRISAGPVPAFTITPLLRPNGTSEPEVSTANDGTMGIVSLQWLFDPVNFGTNLWTGPFGSTPVFNGVIDAALQHPGKTIFGAGDADVDMGLSGRLHATTLIFLLNPPLKNAKLGVSAITCPSPAGGLSISQCTEQILDTSGDDRPWITSEGNHVYISYHDSGNSTLIHAQRSDDDGFTWKKIGGPIVGQGKTTADATFNNEQGNLATDPRTHNLYDIYAAGETGRLKAHTFTPNHIIVSRSVDMGKSWAANIVFAAPAGTSLANIFPAMAVDPVNGNLYAVWSDGQTVSFSSSKDQGNTWTPAIAVSHSPATTALFPRVAAYNGTVDVVYYGTTATSNLDPSANWHVYFTQFNGIGFSQTQVNSAASHIGVVCTGGTGCGPGTRNLLDLFKIAIDPQNSKAAIIYTDDTLTTSNDPSNFACSPNQSPPCPLPQAVLAQQN